MCDDCRKHRAGKRNAKVAPANFCGRCKERPKFEDRNECRRCMKYSDSNVKRTKEIHDRIKQERIAELGYCCEVCCKTFLKKPAGEYGFDVVDSMKGVELDQIELRNLEFDHLTKEEQLARGHYYGEKTRGVAGIKSYNTGKKESKKCQLTCLACHCKETIRRRDEARNGKKKRANPGKDYVNACKLEAAECSLCGCFDETNLSYFHWDHIDPSKKIANVSRMVSDSVPIPVISQEVQKCRLSCGFCDRIYSGEQYKAFYPTIRYRNRLIAILHDMVYHDIYYPFEVFTKKKIPL